MKNNDKTNVMRVLDSKKIKYESHSYDPDPVIKNVQHNSLRNFKIKAKIVQVCK